MHYYEYVGNLSWYYLAWLSELASPRLAQALQPSAVLSNAKTFRGPRIVHYLPRILQTRLVGGLHNWLRYAVSKYAFISRETDQIHRERQHAVN